ncbi:MAG: right-handed parallel beta-helix repeat-containing protein [Candidatus Eisenbacteria bacterium]|nr:right-handed parallel beta-helix repeat-containing protein [Candidatus Eisenbacteria bacterium]
MHFFPDSSKGRLASLFAVCAIALALPARADYATPGSGVTWTMEDLVAHSGGAVTGGGGAYEVHQTVIVSVSDRVSIGPGERLTFLDTGGVIGLTVRGALSALGTEQDPIIFDSATAVPGAWRGFVYSDTQAGSEFHLAWCEIAHANIAVDIVGADVLVEHCHLHDTLDKVIDFSSANGVVRDCRLVDNRRRTIVMTLSSSPLIEGCWMENNNIDNASPYPYVNIGLQGTNSPTIRGCTILGSNHQMSGGIAIWNAGAGLIEGNHIEGCGYGILCYQAGASPAIRGNTLVANNIHPDTLNWGFGVACNGNNAPVLAGNVIRGQWYGVCAINGGRPNLGNLENASPDDDGGNEIYENGLSRIYGFYNNTALSQMAQGNWWGGASEQEVEDAIWHQVDDPALGLVDYSGWLTASAVGEDGAAPIPERRSHAMVRVYPNPAAGSHASIAFQLPGDGSGARGASAVDATIFDAAGRVVREWHALPGSSALQVLEWDCADAGGRPLTGGLYFCKLSVGRQSATARILLLQ